jgi:alcohol dehydrogenase class IV
MRECPENLLMPSRTVARAGAADTLFMESAAFGARGLLVHGRSLRAGPLERILAGMPAGLKVVTWESSGSEPTLAQLRELLAFARERNVEWVAGVGGGSVMDLAKACAGLLRAPDDPVVYHDGAEIPRSDTPFIAMPTTAGTGSECTMVCVLTHEITQVKKSFRHPSFMARLVILDGLLVTSCPPAVVAASGMDALTQAIESFVSKGSTRFTDALALDAMRLVCANIEPVFLGRGGPAAMDILIGSYYAGLALSHARLGVVHGLAHPLGARFHAPHGLACAICLPHALTFNREAIGDKWAVMSQAVGADVGQKAEALLERLELKSPFLGRTLTDRPAVITETLASGSTAANPRPVCAANVEWFLDRMFLGVP